MLQWPTYLTFGPLLELPQQPELSSLHPGHEPLHEGREGEYAGADGDAYLGVVSAEADEEAEVWREEEEGG